MFTNGDISSDFVLSMFADPALTVPITPTAAIITHITAYLAAAGSDYNCGSDTNNCTFYEWANSVNATGLGVCGVNYAVPWNTPIVHDVSSPPIFGSHIADGDAAVSFDPAGSIPLAAVAALAYNTMTHTIAGFTGPFTILVEIETDVGTCVLPCGSSFCF